MAIDQDKLQEFLGKFVGDLGATVAAGNVVIGHRLGLYTALAAAAAPADELASRTGTSARYVAEWLRGQAVGGYVQYDPASGSYSMTEEQVLALTDPDGAVYAPGAFVLALGALRAEPRITEAFRTGAGFGWHQHDSDVFSGCEQFFRPGYIANLIPSWIPARDGVADKLRAGATVEPAAADDIAGNLNPVGRAYYSFSTLLCVPNALSQPGGYALGAQAGEAAIRQVATDAGFTRFRRAAETPFNLVYEVRP